MLITPENLIASVFGCLETIFTFGKHAFAAASALVHALGNNKNTFSAMESIAKSVALIVAGWWTWQTYVRKRVRFPGAKVEHLINHWEDAEHRFLRVTLRMTNTGNVMIPITEGFTWIQQMTPLPEPLHGTILAGGNPLQAHTTEFGWTLIGERQLQDEGIYEIEPGETDEFHFDFMIPKSVLRVLIYSHLQNQKKRGLFGGKEIGWNLSTICEIRKVRKGIFEWLTKNV
jgi:hypothetical protein